ncbi:hypothetical protein HPB47_015117 [Ixodes persulcatus]|uniref:Uncharacterized protein n=1 Tax=Ixodes persulcatus TaxID=34615 RepID=A0AC60QUC3_IXOPE|nr:hypothetical protein HPB47_015117 [Ixodes persulcatus]
MIAVVGPSQNDPTVTKVAYWCRKQYYALNVVVVCDADCRVMSIDPRYPGSVHDSFAWRYSWLRSNFEQGRLIDDGRFLLGDSGYALQPWLITPVSGYHAASTACGRFNKAHSSMSSEPATAVPPRSPTQATVAVSPIRDTTSDSKPLVVLTSTDALATREALPVAAYPDVSQAACGTFRCVECGSLFSSQDFLSRHQKKMHKWREGRHRSVSTAGIRVYSAFSSAIQA